MYLEYIVKFNKSYNSLVEMESRKKIFEATDLYLKNYDNFNIKS